MASRTQQLALFLALVLASNLGYAASRNSGAQAASITSGIAAGVAALSCMKLYEAAEQARAAGNEAQAQLLSTQAAQQCAQAAQNAANSGQNQGASDAAKDIQDTKADTQNTAQTPTPTPTAEDPGPLAPLTDDSSPAPQVVADDSQPVAPSAFEAPAASELTNGLAAAPSAMANLNQIPNDGITYNEDAPAVSSNGFGSSGSFGSQMSGSTASNTSSPALASTASASAANEDGDGAHGRIGRRGAKGSETAAGASGDSSGENGDSSSPLKTMFANLMGGAPAEQAVGSPTFGGGSMGDAAMASKKAPNIFEYAGYRFRKLNREGEVRVSKPTRSIASTQP